jgi:hypothetical protein
MGPIDHRDCDRTIRPKSLERWRRLTLLAQAPPVDWLLLEDAVNMTDFLEASGRTLPRDRWVDEAVAAVAAAQIEGMF